ncbi:DUF2987 domain-containing protein [Psychromonas sp.]|uniref:DUF2987 domain-containing protein n=1 Tax=Psychromonas sp. TaxID=1884585 RepID=UPI0035637AE0
MRLGFFWVLLLTVNSAFGASLKLDYSLFFGYMKTLYKLEYEHVTTAFYLRDKQTGNACLINNAYLLVDRQRDPIQIAEQGRLLPFYSDQHRKDGATIEVELLAGQENYQCDLQVTIMAKQSELGQLSYSKLALISTQLEGVLKKNAGMVGKYFLPDFSGVRVQLAEPLSELQLSMLPEQVSFAENGDLLIANAVLHAQQADKNLALSVSRITPWLSQ